MLSCIRFFCCCCADKPTNLLKDKLLPQGSNDGRPNIESTNIHITPNYLSLDQAPNTTEDRYKTPPRISPKDLLKIPPRTSPEDRFKTPPKASSENRFNTPNSDVDISPDSNLSRSTHSSREGTPNY